MLVSVKDPYMLVVQPDDFFINPRELDEPSSRMICFHSRYALGDRHEFRDKDDFLHKLFVEAAGGGESGEEQYDRTIEAIWEKHKNAVSIPAREVDDALLEVIKQKNVVLPLYLYDHSGLYMRTTDFGDPWDSGQVGWIYISGEDALKTFGAAEMTDEIRQQTEAMLRDEVALYDSYLCGECYGYELYKNGVLSDSCWGFIGDIDEVRKAIADQLPAECADLVETLSEMDRPPSMIQTLLRHARMQVRQAEKDVNHEIRQQKLAIE